MGKSIVTDQWKNHLYKYFREHGDDDKIKVLDSVDWNAWLHGEGLELPVKLEYDTSLAEKAYVLADRWDTSRTIHDVSQLDFKESDLEGLDTNQIIVFLERLQTFPALLVRTLNTLQRSINSQRLLTLKFVCASIHLFSRTLKRQ